MSESEYSSPIATISTCSEGDLADYQGSLADHLDSLAFDSFHLVHDHSPPGVFS
jgi:hypothetical protein